MSRGKKKVWLARHIVIDLGGRTEDDLELALSECMKKLNEGYIKGHDSNDDGAYWFNVTLGKSMDSPE